MALSRVPEWQVDVVRHAEAGDREIWTGPDSERPLTEKGLRQAAALVAYLEVQPTTLIISSPAMRCVQTVEPLARRLGMRVEVDARFMEGESFEVVHDFISSLQQDAVICSHGDIIGELVFDLIEDGMAPPGARLQKASTWRLICRKGEIVSAEYLPPPPKRT